ncbi:SPOR domain-containing protein [Bacteroidota bacterium]
MLSNQLGHIILTQLSDNQLVVLPRFGGFVLEHIPAKLDELRNRIQPPGKTVLFNSKLVHNDGLLIATIAQTENINYSEADDWLTDAVSELRFRLENKETVVWEGLGSLRKTLLGQIQFEFSDGESLQAEGFGLKPLSLERVQKDNVDKIRKLVASDGPVATSVRTIPLKKVASYAAAAAVAGLMMWMPFQKGIFGNSQKLVHQLNPFNIKTEAVYTPRTFNEGWLNKGFEKKDVLADKFEQSYLTIYLTDDSYNPIIVHTDAIPTAEIITAKEIVTAKEEPVLELANAAPYRVIAATFKSKAEAADYVAKMIKRGFTAEYAGKDEFGYLVAYGSYNSLQDAKNMLASVRLSNKEARIIAGS